MGGSDTPRCPWRGPEPYDEEDAPFFYGREQELRELCHRSLHYRMTVVTSPSGAGKTSLLRAGLVPRLRSMRTGDRASCGPILLLRDWGLRVEPSPILQVLNAASQCIQSHGRIDDYSTLQRVDVSAFYPEPGTDARRAKFAAGYFRALCDALEADGTGRLLVVVDQAEELLGTSLERPDAAVESEALGILGSMFASDRRVTLVVCLRKEYLENLRPLEALAGGLDRRTQEIVPLGPTTTSTALRQAADQEGSGATLTAGGASLVLEWARQPDTMGTVSREGPVDLLGLQALLVNAYETRKEEGRRLVIDNSLLEAYADERLKVQRCASDGLPGPTILRAALFHYIERAFEGATRKDEGLKPGGDALGPLGRRVVARIARFLSGPSGFKRTVEEAELVDWALGDDLAVLSAKGIPSLSDLRAMLSPSAGREPDREALGLFANEEDRELVSGAARTSVDGSLRTPRQVAAKLLRAVTEATEALRARNVLAIRRSAQKPWVRAYQLVHDGFGQPLIAWAEAEAAKPDYVLASLAASRGVTFPRFRLKGPTISVAWLGCCCIGTVGGEGAGTEADFEAVEFRDCLLKGSVFLRCSFRHCRFTAGSGLEAVCFIDCVLEDVVFENCDCGAMLFERSTLSGIVMRHTNCAHLQVAETSTLNPTPGTDYAIDATRSVFRLAQMEEWKGSGKVRLVGPEHDRRNAALREDPWVRREDAVGP